MTQWGMPAGNSVSTERALALAEAHCRAAGARLTPLRRRVLGFLLDTPLPLRAYDLIEQLGGESGQIGPPTVYRTLDFLLAQGLVHRLASRAAFVPCMTCGASPGHAHAFLLCRSCGRATEIEEPRIKDAIALMVARAEFRPTGQSVEIEGTCADCTAEQSLPSRTE